MSKLTEKSKALVGLGKKERPKPKPVVPLPDHKEIEEARRRKASARRSGRASTILSDGLGG
jgi:hypothetical protein